MTRRGALRRGRVYHNGVLAGLLEETETGFRFGYDPGYLADPDAPAISLTLPRRAAPFASRHLFPFFFGLLAEGPTKELQCRRLRLDENDPFGRLLATLRGDVIGGVSVAPDEP